MRAALPFFLLLSACSSKPVVQGQVKDVFGKPLPGATVAVSQLGQHFTTDAQGHFQFEAERGAKLDLQAGKEGYVPEKQPIEVPTDPEQVLPPLSFTLWPSPQEPGFYTLGDGKLVHLEGTQVVAKGSDYKEVHGLRNLPDITIHPGKAKARFLFRSTLRDTELKRLDLELDSLVFQEKATLPGLMGDQEVELGLWVKGKQVPFSLRALDAEDLYLLLTDNPLEPGDYAFQAQNVLNSTEPGSLEHLPKEMQVVYAFQVK